MLAAHADNKAALNPLEVDSRLGTSLASLNPDNDDLKRAKQAKDEKEPGSDSRVHTEMPSKNSNANVQEILD